MVQWPASIHGHHPHREGKLPLWALAVLAISAVALILLLEWEKGNRPDPHRAEKADAKNWMRLAMKAILDERIRLGIPIDPVTDPGRTGLIGAAYTDLTTTRGSLASKRTSTNPEFAAAIVGMLKEAGVRRGDPVAVSFSGSFPALNIAVLSAARAMDLKPVVISSLGASQYGANVPGLTWLDMERVLAAQELLPYRSRAASLGGIADTNGGLDGTGIDQGLRAIRRSGAPLLAGEGEDTLQADIRRRMELYDRELVGRRPAAFINVGGPLTSLGNVRGVDRMPTGLLKKIPAVRDPARGVLFLMGERGVPVVHLLKIRMIAAQYGIPFDPALMPPGPAADTAGASGYSASLAFTGLVLLLLVLFLLMRIAPCRGRIRGDGL
ncbi:MAG: poly-gamma-glutamate system protein [Syntrophales bacterium]